MKKAAQDIDEVAQGWLEEHKRRRASGEMMGNQDFMDVMLGMYETGQVEASKFDVDTVIKATCMVNIYIHIRLTSRLKEFDYFLLSTLFL